MSGLITEEREQKLLHEIAMLKDEMKNREQAIEQLVREINWIDDQRKDQLKWNYDQSEKIRKLCDEYFSEIQNLKAENEELRTKSMQAGLYVSQQEYNKLKGHNEDLKSMYSRITHLRTQDIENLRKLKAENEKLKEPVIAITDGPIVSENITIDTRYRFECEIKKLKNENEMLSNENVEYAEHHDVYNLNRKQLLESNQKLKSRVEKLREALTSISKMWHDDCGCMVECKLACEALSQDNEREKRG